MDPGDNDTFYTAFSPEGEDEDEVNHVVDPVVDHVVVVEPAVEEAAAPIVPTPAPEEERPAALNTEEFEAREEEDLWMAAPPTEPPPSPAPATFEPNLQHTTVSVEDIAHLSTEVGLV